MKAKKDVHTELKRGVELGMPEKEFKRLTEKMFPKWVNDDSKIARFMHNLDPERMYSKTELLDYMKIIGLKDLSQLMNIRIAGTIGFGIIIQKTSEKYSLYPELVNAYNKYF